MARLGRTLTVNPTLILYFYDSKYACLIYHKFLNFYPKKGPSYPPKNPQRRNTYVFQGLRCGGNILSDPTQTQRDTKKRALRLCCVGRGGESATPQPMNGMVCRETLRRGGNFLGCRGRTIATVFEKSFCGTINIGGECFAGFFSVDKIHRQTHNP
jgi:hypothetical protein